MVTDNTAEAPEKPLTLSVAEAARLLGFGRNTVYGLIERGELPVVRLGAKGVHMRIPRAAVERLAAGEEIGGKNDAAS